MKIFLDFDGTLFDTENAFKRDLFSVFVSCGISLEMVEDVYEEMSKTRFFGGFMYSPQQHAEALRKKNFLKIDEKKLLAEVSCFMKGDLSRYVFSDSFGFLNSFKKSELHILTFGEERYQKEKIAQSGVKKYVADVFVVQEEKSKTIARMCQEGGEKIFFLDDSLKMVSEMKRSLPWVQTILLSRPGRRRLDAGKEECDFEVRNLEEARRNIKERIVEK